MGTLKEEAQAFEPKEKLNVADLEFFDVNMMLTDITKNNSKGEEYTYKAFVDGRKEYYVPESVLQQVKELLKLKPDSSKFKVKRSGSGMLTKYKVEVLL